MEKRTRFLAAARCQPVDRPPVWLMRQAGRYLPEYRELRARHSFLECCKTSALCAEITLQPLARLDVDAVIIFQDILTPLEPLGVELHIGDGGPRIGNPVQSWADLERLREVDLGEEMAFVGEAHREIRRRVGEGVAQIGFCGAPYTVATYLVEGATTKDHKIIKRMRWTDPALFTAVLTRLADGMASYLAMQAAAGADALMVFDTWASDLTGPDFQEFAIPAVQRVIDGVRKATDVPVIYFPRGINGYWPEALASGADVLGFDHGIDLGQVRDALGAAPPALQGNLDPHSLYGPPEAIAGEVARIHASMKGQPGHIFNLGHGILPDVPVEGAQAFVQAVKALGRLTPDQPSTQGVLSGRGETETSVAGATGQGGGA
ncbi:MAG TPA: uroporphyrinogen decarboxylase [bacterium]|nr:uroporphyrinogen decarboxylase [bacterium]